MYLQVTSQTQEPLSLTRQALTPMHAPGSTTHLSATFPPAQILIPKQASASDSMKVLQTRHRQHTTAAESASTSQLSADVVHDRTMKQKQSAADDSRSRVIDVHIAAAAGGQQLLACKPHQTPHLLLPNTASSSIVSRSYSTTPSSPLPGQNTRLPTLEPSALHQHMCVTYNNNSHIMYHTCECFQQVYNPRNMLRCADDSCASSMPGPALLQLSSIRFIPMGSLAWELDCLSPVYAAHKLPVCPYEGQHSSK